MNLSGWEEDAAGNLTWVNEPTDPGYEPLAPGPLAEDYVVPVGSVPVYDAAGNVIGSEPARPLQGGAADFYTSAGDPNPQPLTDEVIIPPGVSADQAAQDAARGMPANTARRVTMPDGTSRVIVSSATPPLFPDPSLLYKVGSELLRYVAQANPANPAAPPVMTAQPVGGAAGLSTQSLLLLGLGAYLLLT